MKDLLSQIKPLTPIHTEIKEELPVLDDIQCVIFDIYGTLVISASGDIGSTELVGHAALKAFEFCETPLTTQKPKEEVGKRIIDLYTDAIKSSHAESKQKGILYPEVNIIKIWETVISKLKTESILNPKLNIDPEQIAFCFEFFENAIYPMPNLKETLEWIQQQKKPLGIISNAQFFTPKFLNHFLQNAFEKHELPYFDPELIIYSYELGFAKPDTELYYLMSEKVEDKDLEPKQCLYIGNDMLNDIAPAKEAGFKTCLFAGDKRSLRLREDHPRCKNIKPDAIIKDLSQLKTLLGQ